MADSPARLLVCHAGLGGFVNRADEPQIELGGCTGLAIPKCFVTLQTGGASQAEDGLPVLCLWVDGSRRGGSWL